jgi:hypothetical protein
MVRRAALERLFPIVLAATSMKNCEAVHILNGRSRRRLPPRSPVP